MAVNWASLSSYYFQDSFAPAPGSITTYLTTDAMWHWYKSVGNTRIFQRSQGFRETEVNNRDSGYFYWKRDSDGALTFFEELQMGQFIGNFPWGDNAHGSYQLRPLIVRGDVPGDSPAGTTLPWAGYCCPFNIPIIGGDVQFQGWISATRYPGAATLWHFQPWAFIGYRMAGPMAAVVVLMSLTARPNDQLTGASLCNQSEFDNSDSSFAYAAGSPFAIYTLEGETLATLLKKMIRHDPNVVLNIDRTGKLALTLHDSVPLHSVTGQGPSYFGVTDIKWRRAEEYCCNKASLRWGSSSRITGDNVATIYPSHASASQKDFRAKWEELIKGDPAGKWRRDVDNLTSQTVYGVRPLSGRMESEIEDQEPVNREVFNFPFARRDTHVAGPSLPSAGYPEYMITNGPDCFVPRVVEWEGDWRGLALDLGHVLWNCDLGDAGPTAAKAIKIRQVLDFRNNRVKSTWLERPSSGW